MAYEIVLALRRFMVLAALMALAACDTGAGRHANAVRLSADDTAARLLERYEEDARHALRMRADAARGRIWMLGLGYHVRVYDQRSKALLRHIRLPGWHVVKTPCMPDLILDRTGSAYVSSNVSPWIWQIDATSFQLWVHEVRMAGKEVLDVGFGALAFDRKGTLYGLAPSASSVWSIDVVDAKATMIESHLPPLETCALGAPLLERFEAR